MAHGSVSDCFDHSYNGGAEMRGHVSPWARINPDPVEEPEIDEDAEFEAWRERQWEEEKEQDSRHEQWRENHE